jgi:cytochrome c biogenesis protein
VASNPRSSDPSRPADHIDAAAPDDSITQPRLGPAGMLRFAWRQLTSMRTALVLLLLLALAAIPGSLVPQRSSDPNGVIRYRAENPDTFTVLDALGVFSTFTSPWFSAVYLLLFVSLVGCIVPRAKHHVDALRARPPRTPARLERLVGHRAAESDADAETSVATAAAILKRQGYRVERYATGRTLSVSAERGYRKETGNLVFHVALVGVLVAVGLGGGFGYTGQRVIVQDSAFANVLADYDSFHRGALFSESALEPYTLRLDDFEPTYDFQDGVWHPLDFDAQLSVRERGGDWVPVSLRVNQPLEVGGTQVYLLGNGFAPVITVRDPDGEVVFAEAVPFLPQDGNLTSLGVVKIPDGLDAQLGMRAGYYPNPVTAESGALASWSPLDTGDGVLTLTVYRGDLGLDDGGPSNEYTLDIDGLEELAGREDALFLQLGDRVDLPDGLGTVEFTELRRFVSLDIHHDPTQGWVLGFSLAAVAGLLLSLFTPRRRVWVTATPAAGGSRVEYAGLARGEDPALPAVVADLARAHAETLERRMRP